MKPQFEQSQFDSMRRDPNNYKWGVLYFNPKDPGIIVPKRNQWLGVSLNFANIKSYLVILGVIALIIFIANIEKFIQWIK